MSSQSENSDGKVDLSTTNIHQLNENILDSKKLNYEEERIKSFISWPVHYPVDPVRLAKAGFYYTGNTDEVVCFSCQGHIKNWDYGDIVLKKHSDLYPDCAFIRNVSNNVPLSKTSIEEKSKLCNTEECSDKMQLTFDIDYEKMKSEDERKKTFIQKWPLTNVNVADLAHAGYFYIGTDDKIQCAFCKVLVSNLKVSSSLNTEYLKHFPWCEFLSEKSKYCETKEKKETPWYKASSQDICGNMKPIDSSSDTKSLSNKFLDNNQQNVNLEDLGVYLHKNPVHPRYASLMARLSSFSSWPSNAPISKEDLAAAGFFHLGVDDRTVCFYCNGGLKQWEKGDDPWEEHAQWFSDCNFVRLNKGSDFIVSCLLKTTSTFMNENLDVSSGSGSSESLLKKLDEALKSNMVVNLAEAGIFPSYILRTAVLLQIKQTGSSFTNYDDLCVAASYLKDKMEQHYFDKKPPNAEDLNIHMQLSENLTISDVSEEKNKLEQIPSHSLGISDERNLNKGESLVSGGAHQEKPNVQVDEKEDHYLCKICMDRELGVVFLPCGHLPACTICAPALKNCPLCREPIQATVRCYLH